MRPRKLKEAALTEIAAMAEALDRIPTESQLAYKHRVSKATISRALKKARDRLRLVLTK